MRKSGIFILPVLVLIIAGRVSAQTTSDLDLSTRCNGVPPSHDTVNSAAQWMQNPVDQKLSIAVTNLYADATNYLEIDIGGQREIFYGAGKDFVGNYIPTNYPPVVVNVVLRREYGLSIMCPNAGPNGSPLFKWSDFSDPDAFISNLTNDIYTPAVSAFIWTNFTAQAQAIFTNADPGLVDLRHTNLVSEMNRIITTMSFYTNIFFASFTNTDPIPSLLAQNPTGQQLWYVNRLLLQGAISLSANSGYDNSGSATITFSVEPPPELKIKKSQPAPNYTVLVNRDSTSGGMVTLGNSGTGNVSTNYSIIEIIKDKFGHFGLGDGCDDATKSPGQGTWLRLGPGCTQDTNRISMEWSVSLGRTFDELAAGQLAFREPGLTRDCYTPTAIFYNAAYTNLYAETPLVPYSVVTNLDGTLTTNAFVQTNLYVSVILITTNISYLMTNSAGNVYTNYDSLLRQVKGYQTFVDIVTPDTNQTVLNFYLSNQVGTNQDVTGLYTNFQGSPFVVWTIKNPSPATVTNLLVTENRLGGGGATNSLTKNSIAGGVTWTLTQGTGTEQRVETRAVSFLGSPATDRVEFDSISSSGTPAYECQETYHFYPWGSELAQTSIPNGSSPLATTYNYYTNLDGGNPDDPYNYGYGQISLIVYPDGYWEKRIYDVYAPGTPFYVAPAYISCIAFHPYLCGASGGAATPDEANYQNCSVDLIYFYINGQRNIDTYDCEVFRDAAIAVNADSGGENQARTEYAQDSGHSYDYNYESDFDSGQPLGLAGHPHYIFSPVHYQEFLYDHGVFDSSSSVFVINATNSFYTWDGIYDQYADHRKMMIDSNMGDSRFYADDSEAGYYGGAVDQGYGGVTGLMQGLYIALWDVYTSVDGHPVIGRRPDTGWGLQLYRGLSRKHALIYHGGNVVQGEEYLYTSLGTPDPNYTLLYKARYYVDSLGRATNVVRLDPVSGQTRTLYTADYRGNNSYDGELLISETDDSGRTTSYAYDSLKRVKSVTVKGHGSQSDMVTTKTYDANGQIIGQTTAATAGGSPTLSESAAYDFAGRLVNHVDQSGVAVATSYSATNRITIETHPGGITIVKEQCIDRFPSSLTGDGCVNEFYSHYTDYIGCSYSFGNVNQALRIQTTRKGSTASSRWRNAGTDLPGNTAWEEWPLGSGTTNTASIGRCYLMNRLISSRTVFGNFDDITADAIVTGNYLDDSGEPLYTLTYPDSESVPERAQSSVKGAVSISGAWYQATTNFAYLDDLGENTTIKSISLEQLNGFQGNVAAQTIQYDADTNVTITTTFVDQANNKITTVTSQPNTSSLNATNVYQNGLPISSSTLSVASPTVYKYDALGRTNQIINPLGFSAYINYDPATGWVTRQTDFTGQTTSYQYYGPTEANAGRLKCQTSATGKQNYYAYTTRGELYHTWGDVPYPAEYRYNEYGDLTNLITYRGGSGWTGSTWPASPGTGDNTYWAYDAASGALLTKIDAQGQSVNYTYDTTTGRLFTRSWARLNGTNFITVTNSYNGFGDLASQEYNDGTPNVYFNNYNRTGQPREIVDGSGTNELTYDFASRLVSSDCTSGLLNGITVSNHFNPYYGRDSVSVLGLSASLEDDYGYDTYGRLATVGSGTCSAAYGYAPNSDLLQTTTCYNNLTPVLTTTRTWDYGMRLRSIANVVNNTPVTSHSYQYDALNRRTQATLEDGSFWQYGYDDRDELTSAQRKWSYFSTITPVSGQQFSYAYDNIGNRQTAGFGGDTNGANLRTVSYTANSLNQYASVTTPGNLEVIGAALATNTVTVNNGTADHRGEYFHREISIANTNQAVWQNVTNISGTFTNKGGLVFPANGQTLAYDADGNLSFDGIWSYQWDGENRLISMTMTNVSGILNSNRFQLQFAYDYQGRRIQKVVYQWNGSSFGTNPVSQVRFVYDGWNLLAEVATNNAAVRSYMWGQDLSGTLDQSGGVGGLLMASISGTNCFVTYDGNGNITALINAIDKSLVGRYEYTPYGELLRETGLLSHQNPFRFSTKFRDEESGLIYYGVRYLNPAIAKWINKDPSEEKGGLNLLAFVENNPINFFDTLGEHKGDQWWGYDKDPFFVDHIHDISHTQYGRDLTKGEMEEEAKLFYAEKGQIRKTDWREERRRGGKGGRGAMLIGAIFLLASVVDGVAAGNDDPTANAIVGDFNDLKRDIKSGDQAWADLDSAVLAADVQTMGSDEAALWVWEAVQQ